MNAVSSVTLNGTGEWDFGGLTPGLYEIRVPGPNGQQNAEVRQIQILPGSRGVVTLEGATPLTRVSVKVDGVEEGAFPTVEFVDMETGRRITASSGRGRGGGRGGRRAGDSEPEVTPNPAPDLLKDQDSPVLTAMLPPHRYAVSVRGDGSAYITGMKATDARVTGLTVEIGAGTPTLTLQVASGRAELLGFVRADAKPLAGTMVLLVPAMLGQPGSVTLVARTESNTDGSFAFHAVVPGPVHRGRNRTRLGNSMEHSGCAVQVSYARGSVGVESGRPRDRST